jgi:hypothetical protein
VPAGIPSSATIVRLLARFRDAALVEVALRRAVVERELAGRDVARLHLDFLAVRARVAEEHEVPAAAELLHEPPGVDRRRIGREGGRRERERRGEERAQHRQSGIAFNRYIDASAPLGRPRRPNQRL